MTFGPPDPMMNGGPSISVVADGEDQVGAVDRLVDVVASESAAVPM